jgi:hypothetical protein
MAPPKLGDRCPSSPIQHNLPSADGERLDYAATRIASSIVEINEVTLKGFLSKKGSDCSDGGSA